MNAIKKKLKSEAGASVTFALLLFLVCAVVGSVVLTAGSAAAGRLANLAKMDQQYYSVISAAGLLQKDTEEKIVTVVRTSITETVTTYNSSGEPAGPPEETTKKKVTVNGEEAEDFFTADSLVTDAAVLLFIDEIENDFTRTLELAADSGDGSLEALSVTVEERLSPDGTLTLDIRKGNAEDGAYTLRMTFAGKMNTETDVQNVSGTPENVTASTYSIASTQTETVTMTARWELVRIQTI